MSRTIKTRPDAALAGLRRSYAEKQKKTLEIIRKAIKKLKLSNSPITLGRIAEASKELTETGKCIAESTILRNPACRELYEKEANPVRRRKSAKRVLAGELGGEPTEAEARRMHYLLRSTKSELVAMIINAERELKSLNSANSLLREKVLLDVLGALE